MSLHGELAGGAAQRPQGATSALVASTRAADGRDGPGRGLSSLLRKFPADAQGEEDGRPRRVRSPTGTEDGQDSWVAPRRARGAGGAGEGQSRSVTWLP